MRPLLESTTRGAWLGRIASPSEIEKAAGHDQFPGPRKAAQLLDDLGSTAPHLAGIVSKIEILNDYTHTGIQQRSLQIKNNCLGGHYDPEESVALLEDALRIFAIATIHMMGGIGREADAAITAQWYDAVVGI